MKRMITLVLFIFITGSAICFAQGFEVGVSGFFSAMEDDSMLGFGLNLGGADYFTDLFGLGGYGNIIYGKYEDVSYFGVDLLIAPVLRVINTEKFALPVAVGVRISQGFGFNIGEAVIVRGFGLGVGANITGQIKFSKGIKYLYLRLQGAYELLGEKEITIIPSVGVAF